MPTHHRRPTSPRRLGWAAAVTLVFTALTTVGPSPVRAVGPPTANQDSWGIRQGDVLVVATPGVLANDTDPDGDLLRAELVRKPSAGSVRLATDGSFTYEPPPLYVGLTSFSYVASDGGATSSPTTVWIHVVRRQTAAPESYVVQRNRPLVIPAPGVLGNDRTDPFLQLTATLVRGPFRGQVELADDGSFVYEPRPWFTGPDSFVYEATDDGDWSSGPITVSIRVRVSNQSPSGAPDSYRGTEDVTFELEPPGLLANDADPDGDALHAFLVSPPVSGFDDFRLRTDGSLYIDPLAEFDGDLNFTYRVTDGTAWSEPIYAQVHLAFVDDPPWAEDDVYWADGPVLEVGPSGVLENDIDIESGKLTARLEQRSNVGEVDLRPDGSFTFSFTDPDARYATFSYRAVDSTSAGNAAQVQIFRSGLGGPPLG
jgi:Bacterial Ig domain